MRSAKARRGLREPGVTSRDDLGETEVEDFDDLTAIGLARQKQIGRFSSRGARAAGVRHRNTDGGLKHEIDARAIAMGAVQR